MSYFYLGFDKSQISRLLTMCVVAVIALMALFYSPEIHAQNQSHIFITETSCPQVGLWTNGVCTLTGNVSFPLVVQTAGITLDGNGYTVAAGAGLSDATILVLGSGITVKNIVIESNAPNALRIADRTADAIIQNVAIAQPTIGVKVEGEGATLADVFVVGSADSNTVIGIQAQRATDLTISNVTVRDSRTGITIFDSDDVQIKQSRITDVEKGLLIQGSRDIVLEKSVLDQVSVAGVEISGQISMLIDDNTITGTAGTGSARLSGGISWSNTGSVISMVIKNNNIAMWDTAIVDYTNYDFGGPIQVSFAPLLKLIREAIIPTVWAQATPTITIWGNNFLENDQAYDIPLPSSNKVALSQNGVGNYWDTYDEAGEGCVDSNGDQVCDEPYQLPTSIADDFPATESFTNPIEPIVSASCSLYVTPKVPGNQGINVRFTSVFADTIESTDSVAEVDISAGSFTVTPTALGVQTISATVTGLGGSSDCATTVLVTGEIPEPSPEPTGASSVLFLPGIMGSRLYEQGQQCDDFGVEQERWFSQSDCDQLRLLTRFDGTSLNDIYTKSEDDAVVNKVLLFFNLYRSFIQGMNDLEESDAIADFVPFAYDWRLRLDDLLKTTKDPVSGEVRYVVGTNLVDSHLYQTVEEMVSDSHNGNVTIVAHSNGGLLAKTFLSALQATGDPLAEKIDNVILVASPQVGTPDAVTGLLYGNEIGAGFVVSQEMARILLNTAPFGHHLLPNQNYFDGEGVAVRTPVVTFKPGAATDDWRSTFGPEITNTNQLHQFLSKDSGRSVPAVDDLLQPQVVDNFLLNYANVIAAVMESWNPNASTSVYQVAGTSVETPAGITYFTDTECIAGGLLWFECSEYAPKLGYYINHTHDGDGTVVVPSALAMKESDEVERVWLDLASAGRVHNNIMEVPELITYITNIIQSDVAPALPSNFSSSPIIPEIEKRLSFFLHSPLDMYVESSAGITSSSTDELPGVTYRRYGEVQYVSVPADSADLTLQLRGYESGSFTLVLQEWEGDVLVATENFEAIPTGASTIIELPINALSADTSLEIDFDGDGTIDGVVSAQTDMVVPIGEVIVEDQPVLDEKSDSVSSSGSSATRPNQRFQPLPPTGQVAGVATGVDEQQYYQELLKILEQLTTLLLKIEQQYEI